MQYAHSHTRQTRHSFISSFKHPAFLSSSMIKPRFRPSSYHWSRTRSMSMSRVEQHIHPPLVSLILFVATAIPSVWTGQLRHWHFFFVFPVLIVASAETSSFKRTRQIVVHTRREEAGKFTRWLSVSFIRIQTGERGRERESLAPVKQVFIR